MTRSRLQAFRAIGDHAIIGVSLANPDGDQSQRMQQIQEDVFAEIIRIAAQQLRSHATIGEQERDELEEQLATQDEEQVPAERLPD